MCFLSPIGPVSWEIKCRGEEVVGVIALCVIQLKLCVDQFSEGGGQLSHSHEPCIRKQLANEENNEFH